MVHAMRVLTATRTSRLDPSNAGDLRVNEVDEGEPGKRVSSSWLLDSCWSKRSCRERLRRISNMTRLRLRMHAFSTRILVYDGKEAGKSQQMCSRSKGCESSQITLPDDWGLNITSLHNLSCTTFGTSGRQVRLTRPCRTSSDTVVTVRDVKHVSRAMRKATHHFASSITSYHAFSIFVHHFQLACVEAAILLLVTIVQYY